MELNEAIARKVLTTVDAGLVRGVGKPIPGQMCVEAAVCYALGLPHGDDPGCVDSLVRLIKIRLNDSVHWASTQSRAKGLRRFAIAQLGTAGALDRNAFVAKVAELAIRQSLPLALRAAAEMNPSHKEALESSAKRCVEEGTRDAALAAKSTAAAVAANAAAPNFVFSSHLPEHIQDYRSALKEGWRLAAATAADAAAFAATSATNAAITATYAANAANAEKPLALFAEGIVQILINLNVPGTQWLYLCEEAA